MSPLEQAIVAAESARAGDKVAHRVVNLVQTNTDLKELETTAYNLAPKGTSELTYSKKIINTVLDHYNSFVYYNVYPQDEELNKLYSRQKAVWMGFKKVAEDNDSDTSLWVFNPLQYSIDLFK